MIFNVLEHQCLLRRVRRLDSKGAVKAKRHRARLQLFTLFRLKINIRKVRAGEFVINNLPSRIRVMTRGVLTMTRRRPTVTVRRVRHLVWGVLTMKVLIVIDMIKFINRKGDPRSAAQQEKQRVHEQHHDGGMGETTGSSVKMWSSTGFSMQNRCVGDFAVSFNH